MPKLSSGQKDYFEKTLQSFGYNEEQIAKISADRNEEEVFAFSVLFMSPDKHNLLRSVFGLDQLASLATSDYRYKIFITLTESFGEYLKDPSKIAAFNELVPKETFIKEIFSGIQDAEILNLVENETNEAIEKAIKDAINRIQIYIDNVGHEPRKSTSNPNTLFSQERIGPSPIKKVKIDDIEKTKKLFLETVSKELGLMEDNKGDFLFTPLKGLGDQLITLSKSTQEDWGIKSIVKIEGRKKEPYRVTLDLAKFNRFSSPSANVGASNPMPVIVPASNPSPTLKDEFIKAYKKELLKEWKDNLLLIPPSLGESLDKILSPQDKRELGIIQLEEVTWKFKVTLDVEKAKALLQEMGQEATNKGPGTRRS